MPTELVDHCTYIIRAWKEPTSEAGQWRFLLIVVDSQQRKGFIMIDHLLTALQTELITMTQEGSP